MYLRRKLWLDKILSVSLYFCLLLCMSVSLSVCLSVRMFVSLSVYVGVFLSLCLSVCLSVRPSLKISLHGFLLHVECFYNYAFFQQQKKEMWFGLMNILLFWHPDMNCPLCKIYCWHINAFKVFSIMRSLKNSRDIWLDLCVIQKELHWYEEFEYEQLKIELIREAMCKNKTKNKWALPKLVNPPQYPHFWQLWSTLMS